MGDNFAKNLVILRDLIFYNFFGPKIFPMRYTINLFKGLTFIWVLSLMYYFNNYSTGMWLYLFLHGTYGIAWLIKDLIFPDAIFKISASLGSQFILNTFLIGYWVIPLPLAAGYGLGEPSITRITIIVIIYLLGLVLMMGSDYQKAKILEKRKGLISTGYFSKTRNPNYLGEILIYSSFVFCSGHFYGFAYLYGIAGLLFATNIYLKEKLSYEKKQGFEKYRKQSYIFLPKLLDSDILNTVIYSILGIILYRWLTSEVSAHFWWPLA